MSLPIWFKDFPSIDELNQFCSNTIIDTLSIKFIDFGDDFLSATMPVNNTTVQPFRFLHGGASCVLAETVASCASNLTIDSNKYIVFGQNLTSHHLRPVKEQSEVKCHAQLIYKGNKSQLWSCEISDTQNRLINTTTIQMAITKKES